MSESCVLTAERRRWFKYVVAMLANNRERTYGG